MILSTVSDPFLRRVVRRAASADEDVFWDEERVLDALERGFPRLLVRGPERDGPFLPELRIPVVRLPRRTLEAWEEARRAREIPPPKLDHFGRLLRRELRHEARAIPWIRRTLRDLSHSAGVSLPAGLRGLARRVLEYPALYRGLGPLAQVTGMSPGALKARFRRRDLESPFTYVRWFRAVAVVQGLTELDLTYLEAAYRMGFSGSANLCRFLETTTGFEAGRLTEPYGRERLLARLASHLLGSGDLERWGELEEVFLRGIA